MDLVAIVAAEEIIEECCRVDSLLSHKKSVQLMILYHSLLLYEKNPENRAYFTDLYNTWPKGAKRGVC